MSFLKKLFGLGGSGEPAAPAIAASIEHEGHTIRATPYQSGGRWQLCGMVVSPDGVEEKFVRADTFAGRDEAVEMTLFKGRQMIDLRKPRSMS